METLAFPNPTNTINQGSFNVSDDRCDVLNGQMSKATDSLNDYPNWDEFYHHKMKPLAKNDAEALYIAFSYGKVVARTQWEQQQRMQALMGGDTDNPLAVLMKMMQQENDDEN